MENTEIERSSTELKLTLMARSLLNKESCKLMVEPIEIINLMQSSIDYLTRRSRDKSANVRFIVVPTKEIIVTAQEYGIELQAELSGWRNHYERLQHNAIESVMVMVYSSDAVKLVPNFRSSSLNHCAAFFAERAAFENACRIRLQEHKQQTSI